MVKQKLHTARNQTFKAHRNGIKKPIKHRYRSTKGMDPKFLRNARYALHGTRRALKKKRAVAENIMEQVNKGAKHVTLRSGRRIPLFLCGGEMISVSNRNVMRLLLHNQAALAALFDKYAKDGEMSREEGLKFAFDFDIVPDICNRAQFLELWALVNRSEAADDDVNQCDSEEFTELVVRLGAFYAPGEFNLQDDIHCEGLAAAFRVLLTFMNNSRGGSSMKSKFKIGKITGN